MATKEDLDRQLRQIAALPDEEIDLGLAALLIASTGYDDLDFDFELGSLDSMAAEVSNRLNSNSDPLFVLNTLSEYLFDELGFTGNRDDYYDPKNSYLNDVLDRRLGIPITLSLVYVEVGRRVGAPLVGIGMPMHFLVGHREVQDLFVDPFGGGILLTERECAALLKGSSEDRIEWDRRYLAPVANREFVARMMRNLKTTHLQHEHFDKALVMTDWLLALQPESAIEQRDRGVVHYQLGNYAEARGDLEAYMNRGPKGDDRLAVEDLLGRIARQLGG